MSEFSKAAQSYHSAAEVQKTSANQLFKLIQNHSPVKPLQCFEMGAGTGLLTHSLISWMEEGFLEVNDLSLPMLFQNQMKAPQNEALKIHYSEGDLQRAPWPHCADLICSANTIQWIPDFLALFLEKTKPMDRQTLFAFSTFGSKNLGEFYGSYQEAYGNEFPKQVHSFSKADLQSFCENHGFALVHFSEETFKQSFSSLKEIFEHFQKTGVKQELPHSLTPEKFRRWNKAYPREEGTLPLSWHLQFFLLRKI